MSVESRLSVCQLSLPDSSFEEDLAIIKASGAPGVAVAEFKLRERDEDEQLVDALRDSGLRATECIPANIAPLPMHPEAIYPGPDDPEERIVLMCDSIKRLSAFSPDCVILTTGSADGYTRADARRIATEGIREGARVATENGTRIALEICRGDIGTDFSFLLTLPEAIDFLDEVGDPSIGICYDFYHLWDTPNILEHTERHAARVWGVQYNDWREPPRAMADRLLPGDGEMDIPAMIGALERGGFAGWYDFEVFSDDGRWGTELADSLWKLPPQEMLDRAHAGFRAAWQAARRDPAAVG